MRLIFWGIATMLILNCAFAQSADSTKTVEDATGILVGADAPLFKAVNQNNEPYFLSEALKKGPVVVVFYRGQWCPFCNRHLSNL